MNSPTSHKKHISRTWLAATLLSCGLSLGSEYVYSRVMRRRYEAWNRSIIRDAAGLRDGCETFDVGSGAVGMLMIHGFAASPACYRPLATSLSKDVRCCALRLPGHGEPMQSYAKTSLAAWRVEVDRAIEALAAEVDTLVLVGHSMGAALAIDRVLRDPSRVDGLVLLAPVIDVSRNRSPILSPQRWYQFGRRLMMFSDRVQLLFSPDVRDRDALAKLRNDAFVPIRIFEHLFALIEAIREGAGRLEVPVLMAVSSDDQVVDTAAAHRYFESLTCERRELLVFEDSGHLLQVDREWPRLAEAMASFAQSLPYGNRSGATSASS